MGWICPDCGSVYSEDNIECDCGYQSNGNETKKYSQSPNLPKINRKQGCLVTFTLFVITIFLLFYRGCTINLPAIEGTVSYEGTNRPVEDAYIICFYYKYPLIEAINVGGANRDFNYVEIVKTDKEGKFTLSPYKIISLRTDDTREFLIYKPGQSVLRYFQANSSQFIDMNNHPWMHKVNAKNTFLIPKDFDNENNNIIVVAGHIEFFADHFKYEDPEKYKSNLAIFREIYGHLMNDSERFVNSQKTNKNARRNWLNTMKNLPSSLGLEQ